MSELSPVSDLYGYGAVYTYGGTREVNTHVVGRAVTGLSAFVR